MKPILFNTEMVRAILSGQKTVTRRAVKSQPENAHDFLGWNEEDKTFDWLCGEISGGFCVDWIDALEPPYKPGDILWVRETWAVGGEGLTHYYIYRADYDDREFEDGGSDEILSDFPWCVKWKPSIHMPREAARLFLRVTNVRVERLHEWVWVIEFEKN